MDEERRNIVADIQYMCTRLRIEATNTTDAKTLTRIHRRLAALLRDAQEANRE